MKRKQLLIWGAGVLCLTTQCSVDSHAQTLAGTGAAIGAGATLGAASGAGLLTPKQYAAPATDAMNRVGQGMGDETAGMRGGAAGGAPMAAGTAGSAFVTVKTTTKPLNYGRGSGDEMVRQLTITPRAPRRTTARSARTSRRVARMTNAQRSRLVNAKYKKPAVSYLAWYLPEDRYKVTSKVWQFVTTPNDRFYYRPWASSMRTRNASRVIGFHTWQDAMIAGYRPDPVSKPEPGTQLSYLASLTRGPMLSTYFEYVYAGQITPATFDANLRYVRYVANTVRSHSHTRHLVGETVEKVLGAAMGQNDSPQYVGDIPPSPQPQAAFSNVVSPTSMPVVSSGASVALAPASVDKREEDYNRFGNRAAGLARKPGQ